ncbi:unnamed protein product [Linum trigynum]|uniref:Reverse transcriptase domain-containing protein n=1 Tax=Linum trigynum TaxID=586398 RepID=A0AAV2FWG8_9ROSI
MSKVLPQLVSPNQQASVKGRQISYAGLIAFELLDRRRKSKNPGIMFKLDIEKAFDNVSWDCLFKVLSKLGFPSKWQSWIRGTMCSPVISTLINGEAKGYFQPQKGPRQGDSLSSGLFSLVMDVLSFRMNKVQEAEKIKGFCMNKNRGAGEVSHVLFADDTLIFCDASCDQVLSIMATLVCFQAVSGLRINLDKSIMFTVGDVPNSEFFANIIGCRWSNEPFKYVGFPLGSKVNAIATWDPIIEKYQQRLEGWKARFLSFGGRLVLNKSVLSNHPSYYFSLLRAPMEVVNRIEKIQRRFVWSGTTDNQRIPL